MTSGEPDPVDVQVGRKIYSLRRARGLSQKALATGICVTFQQVQKYETGRNRVAVSTLVRIAQVLGVTPTELLADPEPDGDAALQVRSEDFEGLFKAYQALKSPQVRMLALDFVKRLSTFNKA